MRHINVSTARAELPSLVGSGERIVITRNGQPAAVLLGVDDFRVLRATQDLASDPEAIARVHRVHEQLQRGDHSDLVELHFSDAARADEGAYRATGSHREVGAELHEEVAPRGATSVGEVIEQLSAAVVSIATVLQEQSRTTRGIEKVLEEQTQHRAQLERMQAVLKEETLAEARSAAAEEARHAVAQAISR